MNSKNIKDNGNITQRRVKPSSSSGQSPPTALDSLDPTIIQLIRCEIRLAIRETLTEEFNIIKKEFSCLEESMRSIKKQFDVLQNTVLEYKNEANKIDTSLITVNNRLTDIEKSLSFSSDRLDDYDTRIKSFELRSKACTDCLEKLPILENKIRTMEQQGRECNVEISNLPERRSENLVAIIESVGNEIKHPIRSSDIVAVHRVPHGDQQDRRPKNIIVKFTNKVMRDNVLSAYRTVKALDSNKLSVSGSPTRVYLNEHLTLYYKQLFRQCREAAKQHGYRYVWIKHGTVLTRKSDTSPVIAIRLPSDITKIK